MEWEHGEAASIAFLETSFCSVVSYHTGALRRRETSVAATRPGPAAMGDPIACRTW